MPPPVELEEKQRDVAALKKMRVKHFTADPRSISAYSTTTLSWEVTFAADFPDDVSVGFFVDGKPVQAVGSMSMQLTSTRTVVLEVRTEHIRVALRQLRINVDDAACRTAVVVRADDIVNVLKGQVDQRFSGSDMFQLQPGGSAITVADGSIGIRVPIAINVDNWFDADMIVGISLGVASGRPVAVSNVTVDVRWHLLEHLASFGCTGVVQSGMEKMAHAFLTELARAEVAPAVDEAFDAQVAGFLDGLQADDQRGRTWVPRQVVLSRQGLTVTGCPLPP